MFKERQSPSCKPELCFLQVAAIVIASLLLLLSCYAPEKNLIKGQGKNDEIDKPTIKDEAITIRFADFRSAKDITQPEFSITIEPQEHPRLIADTRALKLFAKSRGEGSYEAMLSMARLIWEVPELPEFYTAAPGILAASAFAAANREYLALAVKEIDNALAPKEDFTSQYSLERITWAAIGWDVLGGMMSVPDKDTIANTARFALDEDLLPYLWEAIVERDGEITSDDVLLGDGAFMRAYAAAFLWELDLADDEESVREILESSFPIFVTMQEGLAVHLDEVDFHFINGPVDDGLYLACIAWERAAGVQLIDKKLLKRTLDKAAEYTVDLFEIRAAPSEEMPSKEAAFQHLMKWRGNLDENSWEDLAKRKGFVRLSPQVYLHVFLKPGYSEY